MPRSANGAHWPWLHYQPFSTDNVHLAHQKKVLLLCEGKKLLQFSSTYEYLFSCTDSRILALYNVVHLSTELNRYFKILNQPLKELWDERAMACCVLGVPAFHLLFFLTPEELEIIFYSSSTWKQDVGTSAQISSFISKRLQNHKQRLCT